jgi:hypothetical protein
MHIDEHSDSIPESTLSWRLPRGGGIGCVSAVPSSIAKILT